MIKYTHLLSPEMCRLHKNSIFVFGDNLQGWGKGGQAIIRDEPNAYGIPTKREPNMLPKAFFGDKAEEIEIVKSKIAELKYTPPARRGSEHP